MSTINIFDLSPALIDNNPKIALNGAVAELQPDADIFGDVINDWTEMTMGELAAVYAGTGKGNASWLEAGGLMTNVDGGGGEWGILNRRNNISYLDADVIFDISDTKAADIGQIHICSLVLFLSQNNSVWFRYRAGSGFTSHYILVEKMINGVYTKLYEVNVGIVSHLYLRIKRLVTSGPSNNYFYFYTSVDGAVWYLRWSGQITGATFNNTHALQPVMLIYSAAAAPSYTPEHDKYYQYVGYIAAQRFWPDSPVIHVIDNALIEWGFDAGAGHIWALTGASCTKTEPGTSTVKFRVGHSNDGSTVTWVDATWKTIAQVNANAAAGNYDGHRYLHVQSQFYSDGADQPSLTDFTISGAAIPPSSAEYNLDEMTNDLDAVPLI